MDRNIGLEAVRLTEAASIASARVMGRGDEHLADQAAVDAMRKAFNQLNIRGTIVIGEGERDEAPMLYIGEKVGRGDAADPEVDIALDPLEGTTITATNGSANFTQNPTTGIPGSIGSGATPPQGLSVAGTYLDNFQVNFLLRSSTPIKPADGNMMTVKVKDSVSAALPISISAP